MVLFEVRGRCSLWDSEATRQGNTGKKRAGRAGHGRATAPKDHMAVQQDAPGGTFGCLIAIANKSLSSFCLSASAFFLSCINGQRHGI